MRSAQPRELSFEPSAGQRVPGWLAMWLAVTLTLSFNMATAQREDDAATIRQLTELRNADETTPDALARLHMIENNVTADLPYPVRRAITLTRLALLAKTASRDQRLILMKSLRDLAESNGDTNTMILMDIRRIAMTHADNAIDTFIDQLNALRAGITADASVEVMEALESTYGNLYFDAGNFDTALRHQLAALDWAGRLSSGRNRARLHRIGIIAELYNAMDLPESALDLVDRGFTLEGNKKIGLDNTISLLSARSMALMHLGRMTESESALREAEMLAEKTTSNFTAMRMTALRIELLLATSRPAQAMDVVDRLTALAQLTQNAYYIAKSGTLRGEALLQLGKIDEGLDLMQQGIDYFKSKGQMVDLLASLNNQIAALRDKKLFELAVTRMDQRSEVWSQLFRNERGRAIAEVEARHSAETFERRISTLATQNRAQQESLRAERLGTALAVAIALLGISLSITLFMGIRRTRRERDSLSTAVSFDALTTALSRYQFQRRDPSTPASSAGVLLLDLDNFKATNDRYGHEAGDEVLKRVVERIREVIDKDDEIYRWGGEEFLVVLNAGTAAARVERVRQVMSQVEASPVLWHGHSLPVGISGGFLQHPLASDWETPLADSIGWVDAALYVAKNDGRGRIEQVTLSPSGSAVLKGRRPIDMAQLLDWQHRQFLMIETIAQAKKVS